MKIAMLGHKRMPSREGGIEVVVEELSTRMAALGHDVTVYSRKGHNVAGSEFDEPIFQQNEYDYRGVHVKQVPTIDIKGLAAVSSSFAAMKAAIQDKPDVIHVHAEGPCAAIKLAKRAGIRTVATIHGLDWQRAKWGKIGSAFIKYGEKTTAKYADEIIVLSENVQEYFEKAYNRSTTLIPNGIEMQEKVQADEITRKFGLEKDDYILYLGRLVPEKGIHYLIQAYKGIKTDKKLVIAGGASDSKEYGASLMELANGDPRILFTGFVQGETLSELYSNSLAYVLPSDLEGMPMSLLEAMSYGCCCITSDIPECKDVIGDAGLTFAKGDVKFLQSVLSELLDNDETISLLKKESRNRANRLFNWDTVVDQTLALYKKDSN